MKNKPIMQNVKAELLDAYANAGISNAEFARRAGVSEPQALHIRDPYAGCRIDTLVRAFAAVGKRLDIRVLPLALLPLMAFSQIGPAPCPVRTDVLLHTYDGPIAVTDLCLTVGQHTGDHLTIEARDDGDGIFRSEFEVTQ